MLAVDVIGVGMTPFAVRKDASHADIGVPAMLDAMADADIDRSDIDACFVGSSYGGPLVGQRTLAMVGLLDRPVTNVENACSSGATALRLALISLQAGIHETVLVLGIDKLSQFSGGPLPLNQEDYEVTRGITMPSVYAMRAQRYMHQWGASAQDLAEVAVKARQHAEHNANAQFRSPITADDVLGSRPISSPLTLLQCCPTGDGAAAVILQNRRSSSSRAPRSVEIIGSAMNAGKYSTGFRSMDASPLTASVTSAALEDAGINVTEVDLIELHDAFTLAELLYYEAMGLCGKGEAPELLRSGATRIGGTIPVNPSGGLLSRGHPVGATGTAQVYEAVLQLRGEAGVRQVSGARRALTHVTGGGLSGVDHGACTVHVFER
jgi:benzoylsuccinyl-CoA thiolase BbsB subunit